MRSCFDKLCEHQDGKSTHKTKQKCRIREKRRTWEYK